VRRAIITDTSTGQEYEITGRGWILHHFNDPLDALKRRDEEETAVSAERTLTSGASAATAPAMVSSHPFPPDSHIRR
jgi:hypothetical protein